MSAWQVGVTSLVGVASRTLSWRSNGRLRLTVMTKAAFDFAPNGSMKMSTSPPEDILETDVAAGDDLTGAIRASGDLQPFRPRVDLSVWGWAHAPGGKPVQRLRARVALANQTGIAFDKVIDVVGDRTTSNPNPIPFVKMPLVYERAYGGPGHLANPVGVGFGPRAHVLPNLLYPAGWNRDAEPAALGPIPESWERRSRLKGQQVLDFRGKSVVSIPDQMDLSYFQSAPDDQRLQSIDGNEWILLENMHPTHSRLTTRLPDVAGMAMAFGLQGADQEIPLRIDSLLIDAEREKCFVTCRGSIPLPNEAALDGLRLAAGIGWAGQPLDWTEARKKAHEPTQAPIGTALLDPNATVKFSTPYEIAKPGNSDSALVRPRTPIPGAPFATSAAAAAAAAVVAGTAPALPRPGEMTLIGGDRSTDISAGMPFPVATSSAEAVGTPSSGPPSGLPGAPFAVGGVPAQPAAPAAPLGATTLPLGDDSFFPPDFDALLQARAATAQKPKQEPASAPAFEAAPDPALDLAPDLAPEPASARVPVRGSASAPDLTPEPTAKSNPAWSWAQPQASDLSPQTPNPAPKAPARRPAEPSPRAVIYSGFTRKK